MLTEMGRPALRTLVGIPDLIGCEIGVQRGINALEMLEELDIRRLYLIDPYLAGNPGDSRIAGRLMTRSEVDTIHQEAGLRLFPYVNKLVWIERKSADIPTWMIPNYSLHYVYMDGDHSYASVSHDLPVYYDRLQEDGLLAGHDFNHGGVRNAVIDFLTKIDRIDDLQTEEHDWWITRGKFE